MIYYYRKLKLILSIFTLYFSIITGYSSDDDKNHYITYHMTSAQSRNAFPLNRHDKIDPENIDQSFYAGQIRSSTTNRFIGSGFLLSAELKEDQLRVAGISALHKFISYDVQAKKFNCYKFSFFVQGSILSQDDTATEYATINIDKVWALNTDFPMKNICLFEGYVTKLNEKLWKNKQDYLATFNLNTPSKRISEPDISEESEENVEAKMWHFLTTDPYQRINKGKLNGIKRIHTVSTMKGSGGAVIFAGEKIVGIHQGTFKDEIKINKVVRCEGSNVLTHIADKNCFEKFSLIDYKNLQTGINVFTKRSTWPEGFRGKLAACLQIDDFTSVLIARYYHQEEERIWTNSVTGQKIFLE